MGSQASADDSVLAQVPELPQDQVARVIALVRKDHAREVADLKMQLDASHNRFFELLRLYLGHRDERYEMARALSEVAKVLGLELRSAEQGHHNTVLRELYDTYDLGAYSKTETQLMDTHVQLPPEVLAVAAASNEEMAAVTSEFRRVFEGMMHAPATPSVAPSA